MVKLNFKRLSIEAQAEYDKYYQACKEKSSDTSFINLWAWDNKYQTEIAFAQNLCWLRFRKADDYVYGPPLGDYKSVDWQKTIAQYLPKQAMFKSVTEECVQALQKVFGKNLEVTEDRDNWEYLYNIADLVALSGEKYRNQRKLSNQFLQNNNYKLEPIDEKNIEKVKNFQQTWFEQNKENSIGLEQENKAIHEVLTNWTEFKNKIFGYALLVDDNIVGYTIGEKQDGEHIIIHFEKALYDVRGAYPALNKLTLENFSGYKYVNREQDLGLAGLRRAKEEYNPFGFVKKYQLFLRQD